MNLAEILKQPEGFTPPDLTVKIEKVYEYKSGENDNGPWSFQNVQVTGGKLKLKGLPEFPETRIGQTVTLRAHSSKQHGLTGLKVNHELYKGKTYDQLVVTNSAKWEWGAVSTNGNSSASSTKELTTEPTDGNYEQHILACAKLTEDVSGLLALSEPAAVQACFATICIDTKNRNVLLRPSAVPVKEEPDPFEPDDEDEGEIVPF